jgi:catechol 2,3-dioxygenase-like lactoylglutathione lyase family enzyme
MRIILSTLLYICFLSSICFAQANQRPQIWGIAKMTFLISDIGSARDYFGKFLGFDEAFSYHSEIGKVNSFKVNDRQFLEFVEDKDAKQKTRLVSVSFETENVEQMRGYLSSKGVEVPEKVSIDGAGNEVILVHDPSGIPVEFINLKPNSLHRKSKGKYLSANRISKRIHHAGLYTKEVLDNDPFYSGILGFKELWRYPENDQEKVQMNYLQIPDCAEMIEHYSSDDVNFSHLCLLVDDMQEAVYTLRERKEDNRLAKPMVGKGKRWILNLFNQDRSMIEFTEAHTVK